jgi:CYTH domain-containing protein
MLWKHTEGRRIKKSRYVMEEDGLVYEVDLYEHPYPFVVVEVEFEDVEAFNRFTLPEWMKEAIDVTDNFDMKAKNIAKHGFRVPKGA